MTSNNINETVSSIKEEIKSGLSVDEVIHLLHQNQFTITQSMKFLVEEYGVNLAEAKYLVSNHPVWRDVVEASEPLKEEFINTINNET